MLLLVGSAIRSSMSRGMRSKRTSSSNEPNDAMFIKSKSWNGYQPLVGPENPGSTILSSTWNDNNFGNIDISCNRAADRPLAKREHHMRSLILSILLENQLSSRRTTCRQQKMFVMMGATGQWRGHATRVPRRRLRDA